MFDIALALAAFCLIGHLASIGLAAWKCARPVALRPYESGVSLVRPVCGLESHVRETLESSFIQDHPNCELIFCAAREEDPVVPLVRELIDRHPHVRARLLVGEARLNQNPKLNNMAKGWTAARHDLVVFADSNLLLPADYCRQVAAAFRDKSVGVVSAPPVGGSPEGFWGEVECAMLNGHAARWQFAAAALGLDFAQGKTLAFRKSAFGEDLMAALATEPAEDAAATKVARAAGQVIKLLAPPFVHPVGPRSAGSFWSRHVRWARLRRASFPRLFTFEILGGIAPALVAFHLSSLGGVWPAAVWLPLALVVWYGPELALARAFGWRLSLMTLPASILRDLMLPAIYVAGWASRGFRWRGHSVDGGKKPMNSPAGA